MDSMCTEASLLSTALIDLTKKIEQVEPRIAQSPAMTRVSSPWTIETIAT